MFHCFWGFEAALLEPRSDHRRKLERTNSMRVLAVGGTISLNSVVSVGFIGLVGP